MSEIIKEQDQTIVKPQTDVVASMASDFKSELKGLLDEGVQQLVVDLDQVEMVDSVGLGVFIATYNSLHQNGGALILRNASSDIRMLLKTMRLDKHFTVETNPQEACHG